MTTPPFDEVLAAARAGRSWALRHLYDELAPAVTGYLRLRGAAEPEDLASETFLGVLRNLERFDGDAAALRSWVFTIAHRRLTDERRRRGRRPAPTPLSDPSDGPTGDVEEEALALLGGSWVREVLDTLSDAQRDVILLRVLADLPVEHVATIVGRRPGAVRALQHRGLERLRRELTARAATDERVRAQRPDGGA